MPNPVALLRLLDSLRMQGSEAVAHDRTTVMLMQALPAFRIPGFLD